MKNKKTASALCLALTAAAFFSAPALAADELLVPVGQAVGIELRFRGVAVTGLAEVDTAEGPVCPAREAGLRSGDVINSFNGQRIEGSSDFLEKAASLGPDSVRLGVTRSGRELGFIVTPARSAQGTWQLGLWLRESVQGVGTVTFYDPATGAFGALGHGVSLPDGQGPAEISGGSITAAGVADVVPGRPGEPGELCGVPDGSRVLGAVEQNTPQGIFGTASAPLANAAALPVAADSQIHVGSAAIIATVDGRGPRQFEVEIVRVDRSGGETRQLTIEVTDPALLGATGGIVQGMSGSPIVQSGMLVGAVTHVLVSDPARGYGISMENMLKASRELAQAA
ncbi:MAG: SpoIVB peptidase [Oscillospiraceae bacterium]|nr:SpoIVB peptidase [Oscillospiraceae bacterium]